MIKVTLLYYCFIFKSD